MSAIDLTQYDLLGLASLIRQKKLSPVELTQACLERIHQTNDKTNAFITVLDDFAIKKAKIAEQEIVNGDYKGLMHGMCYAAKDLFKTKGIKTTCGSKVLADNIADSDAKVIEKLDQAGAILVGKTNMHEFAFGLTNHNPHYGNAQNPWDTQRVTGGSSGGSGAAVASSAVPMALGTDTGGSIRIPASLCGVTGLKPTYGRVSKAGVYPLSWTLDHAGPLTKTAADASVALSVMAGFDPNDPCCADKAVDDYLSNLKGDLKGKVIGWIDTLFFEMIDPEIDKLVRATFKRFQELGAKVKPVHIPDLDKAAKATLLILSSEATSALAKYHRAQTEDFGKDVKSRLDAGACHLATHYIDAMRWRAKIKKSFAEAFENVDLMITPGSSIAAPYIKDATVNLEGVDVPVGVALTRCTRIFNLTGLPSVCLPCGLTEKGLPAAIQLVGRPFEEAKVLNAAHMYQETVFSIKDWPSF